MKKLLLLILPLVLIFSACKHDSNNKINTQTEEIATKKKKNNGTPTAGGSTSITATQVAGGVQLDYDIDTTNHGSGNFINWFNISETSDTTNPLSWRQAYYWQDFNHWPLLPNTFLDTAHLTPGTHYYYIRPVWTMGEAPGALASVNIQ